MSFSFLRDHQDSNFSMSQVGRPGASKPEVAFHLRGLCGRPDPRHPSGVPQSCHALCLPLSHLEGLRLCFGSEVYS